MIRKHKIQNVLSKPYSLSHLCSPIIGSLAPGPIYIYIIIPKQSKLHIPGLVVNPTAVAVEISGAAVVTSGTAVVCSGAAFVSSGTAVVCFGAEVVSP